MSATDGQTDENQYTAWADKTAPLHCFGYELGY